jgi:hypothetical protein
VPHSILKPRFGLRPRLVNGLENNHILPPQRAGARDPRGPLSQLIFSASDLSAPRHVSNFGRRLTHSRYRALNFGGEAFVLEKEERMACDVDTGAVFKRPVHCFSCDQAFYFTLRKIAEAEKLACPLCGSDINLTDEAYGFVVTSVKETIALIDQSSRDLQRTSIAPP